MTPPRKQPIDPGIWFERAQITIDVAIQIELDRGHAIADVESIVRKMPCPFDPRDRSGKPSQRWDERLLGPYNVFRAALDERFSSRQSKRRRRIDGE